MFLMLSILLFFFQTTVDAFWFGNMGGNCHCNNCPQYPTCPPPVTTCPTQPACQPAYTSYGGAYAYPAYPAPGRGWTQAIAAYPSPAASYPAPAYPAPVSTASYVQPSGCSSCGSSPPLSSLPSPNWPQPPPLIPLPPLAPAPSYSQSPPFAFPSGPGPITIGVPSNIPLSQPISVPSSGQVQQIPNEAYQEDFASPTLIPPPTPFEAAKDLTDRIYREPTLTSHPPATPEYEDTPALAPPLPSVTPVYQLSGYQPSVTGYSPTESSSDSEMQDGEAGGDKFARFTPDSEPFLAESKNPYETLSRRHHLLKRMKVAKQLSSKTVPRTNTTCNSSKLAKVMVRSMNGDVSVAKKMVQHATELAFDGTKYDVFCANGEFSYSIHSRKYCEVTKDDVTCFAFR